MKKQQLDQVENVALVAGILGPVLCALAVIWIFVVPGSLMLNDGAFISLAILSGLSLLAVGGILLAFIALFRRTAMAHS